MFGFPHATDKLRNQRTLAWASAYLVAFVLLACFAYIFFGPDDSTDRANAVSGIISTIVVAALGVIANYGHSSRKQDNQ